MTGSEMSAHETSKHKDESIEVEDGAAAPDAVVAKSLDILVRDVGDVEALGNAFKIAKIDAVAAKSLDISVGGLEDTSKTAKTDAVATKSLDVSVGGSGGVGSLGSATKNAIIVTERWETPTISGIRVPMITNPNNLALPPPAIYLSSIGYRYRYTNAGVFCSPSP